MKAILTYLPFLQEAWNSSGKKSYTWKSNRPSVVLTTVVVLLLYVGYIGYDKYETKLIDLKKEIASLKKIEGEHDLDMKKVDVDIKHLTRANLDLKSTLERQDSLVLNLRSALINKESELKTTQLEKQNVEKLLVASANQTKVLKDKIEEVGKHRRHIEESKSEIRKRVLSLYSNLTK